MNKLGERGKLAAWTFAAVRASFAIVVGVLADEIILRTAHVRGVNNKRSDWEN